MHFQAPCLQTVECAGSPLLGWALRIGIHVVQSQSLCWGHCLVKPATTVSLAATDYAVGLITSCACSLLLLDCRLASISRADSVSSLICSMSRSCPQSLLPDGLFADGLLALCSPQQSQQLTGQQRNLQRAGFANARSRYKQKQSIKAQLIAALSPLIPSSSVVLVAPMTAISRLLVVLL